MSIDFGMKRFMRLRRFSTQPTVLTMRAAVDNEISELSRVGMR